MTNQQDLQALWQQGETLARQRRLAPALKAFEALLELDGTHVMALLRASRMAQLLGRYRDALGWLRRAMACRPGDDGTLMVLLRALRTFNENQALLECVGQVGWRDRPVAWVTEVSTLVSTVGANALALEMLDQVLAREPDYPPARYFRGVVRMFFGRMDAAADDLEHCIRLAPHYAQAHWVLSRLRRVDDRHNHVARMQAQLAQARPGGNDEVYLAFGLHNELHELGRHGEAWRALEHGCRAKRRQVPHDTGDARRMYAGLKALCDRGFVAPGHPPAQEGVPTFVPVFVVGMHRSGSTLLEQLLAGHSQVADGGESYVFSAQMRQAADYFSKGVLDAGMVARAADLDYDALGRDYLAGNQWRAGAASHLTEKLPSNFLNLGFIARALPQARFLHMVRDPLDTCFSNLRTMFSGANAFSYDQRELAEWYGQYRDLMAHWRSVMPGRILDVHYAQLVAEPESTMREVFAFCGLPWESGAMRLDGDGRAVATASSPQLRNGIVRDRTRAWAPYEHRLQPLIDGLEGFLAEP